LYYSLWNVHEPTYNDDDAYAQFMMDQLTELLMGYGPVLELWFDSGWQKGHWGWHDVTRWHWRELYDHIKLLQPDYPVLANPGKMNGGELNLLPVDLNCIERIFSYTEDVLYVPDTRPIRRIHAGQFRYLPIETCDSIRARWFYSPDDQHLHAPDTIINWLRVARVRGGNLLLNVPPNHAGLMPDNAVQVLAEVGRHGVDQV